MVKIWCDFDGTGVMAKHMNPETATNPTKNVCEECVVNPNNSNGHKAN